MTDDLTYVRDRIADYAAYDDERARHDSDMRVRAFVGERLSDAQRRLAGALDSAATKTVDDVLFRCMFSDQVFVRKFEHARLEPAMIAALVRSDRRLVEFGEAMATVDAASLRPLAIEIDKEFEYRRAPKPLEATTLEADATGAR